MQSFGDGEILDLRLDRDGSTTVQAHGPVLTDRVGSDGAMSVERRPVAFGPEEPGRRDV